MKDFRIADFDQLAVMSGKKNEAASEGACHSFSIHWLSLMYKDGFPNATHAAERMAALSAGKGSNNPLLQKVFMEAFKEPDRNFRGNDELLVAVRGLVRVKYTFGGGRVYFDGNGAEDVRKIVAAPEYEGMVYSFEFAGEAVGARNGNHSIAFFRKLGFGKKGVMVPEYLEVSIFDPNFGEYLVSLKNFNVWLTRLFKYYSDNIKIHRMFYVKENQ